MLVIALVEIIEDSLSTQAFRRVESGRLTEDQLEDALKVQASEAEPRRLGQILAERGVLNPSSLLRVLFRQKLNRMAA